MLTLPGLVSSFRYSVHLALLWPRLRKHKTKLAETNRPLMQQPLVDLAVERAELPTLPAG